MYTIDYCLACGSTNIDIKSTKLAKFVAWRCFDTPISDDLN